MQITRNARTPSELALRLLSTVVFVPVVIGAVVVGDGPLLLGVLFVGALAAAELGMMLRRFVGVRSPLYLTLGVIVGLLLLAQGQLAYFAFALSLLAVLVALDAGWQGLRVARAILFGLAGVLYITLPLSALLAVRGGSNGLAWTYALLAVTWGCDSFSYLAGRWFGTRRIAVRLSAGKTLQGLVGGVVSGTLLGLVVLIYYGLVSWPTLVLLVTATGVVSAGDLLASGIKRLCNVKHSGIPGLNPLPGHGGVFDRMDGLLLAALWFAAYLAGWGTA